MRRAISECGARGLTVVTWALLFAPEHFGVQSLGLAAGLAGKAVCSRSPWKYMALEQCGKEVGHSWGEEVRHSCYFTERARCMLVQIRGLGPCPLKLV